MVASDWLAGLGLAMFLALPFRMIASLFLMLTSKPEPYDYDAPLVSPLDIRRCLIASVVFVVIMTPMIALIASKDREEGESWQTYSRDHKCVVVDTRTKTEYQFNPATKMNQATTHTEYLWRCEGGDEHWR